jgi:hypothetical protein
MDGETGRQGLNTEPKKQSGAAPLKLAAFTFLQPLKPGGWAGVWGAGGLGGGGGSRRLDHGGVALCRPLTRQFQDVRPVLHDLLPNRRYSLPAFNFFPVIIQFFLGQLLLSGLHASGTLP